MSFPMFLHIANVKMNWPTHSSQKLKAEEPILTVMGDEQTSIWLSLPDQENDETMKNHRET